MFKILAILFILKLIVDHGKSHHHHVGFKALKNRDNSGGGAGGFG